MIGPDFEIERENKLWKFKKQNTDVDQNQIEELTKALTQLTVREASERPEENGDYKLTVKSDKSEYIYQFFQNNGEHFVIRNDYPSAFKIKQFDFEKITGKTAISLAKQTDNDSQERVAQDDNTDDKEKFSTTQPQKKEVMPDENS